MIVINEREALEEYYNHFPLSDYFSFDIHPYTSIVKFDSTESILCEGESPCFLYYLIDGQAEIISFS